MPGFTHPLDPPAFSLVIPAFNEAVRLPEFLIAASAYLTAHYPQSHEVLVVDDGSTDDTATIAARAGAPVRCLRLPANQGKGAAVRAGMLAARGALRLFADADGATPIGEATRLVRALDAGHDIAIGSRASGSGERVWMQGTSGGMITTPPLDAAPRWYVRRRRYLTGRAFAGLVRLVVGTPFADTQCGFKLFRATAANTLFPHLRCDGWAFDVEVLALAGAAGLRVAEVPVSWHDTTGSKVHLGRDAWHTAAALWPIRQRIRGRGAVPVRIAVDSGPTEPAIRKTG